MFAYLWTWLVHKYHAIFFAGWPVFWWLRPTWSFDEIPDQSGKVIVITGGNSGLGLTVAREVYAKGAKVYLACRDETKAREVIELIRANRPTEWEALSAKIFGRTWRHAGSKKGSLKFVHLDLADLHSVERCAREIISQEKRLDVLYANAGLMACPEGLRTKQGYTLQFGTNVIGHHLLIKLLLPLVKPNGRVILTSSAGHSAAPSGGIKYESVLGDRKKELDRWREYGQSKWANIATAEHLAWKEGIIGIAVHPGLVATNLPRHIPLMPYVLKYAPWMIRLITLPAEDGASDLIWVGTCSDDTARELSGKYIIPYQKIGMARPDVLDKDRVERFWAWCEEQCRRHV